MSSVPPVLFAKHTQSLASSAKSAVGPVILRRDFRSKCWDSPAVGSAVKYFIDRVMVLYPSPISFRALLRGVLFTLQELDYDIAAWNIETQIGNG